MYSHSNPVQKLPTADQIKLILSERTHELVSALPDPNEMINHLKFSDFISVTIPDLIKYVQEHGFPNRNVAEQGSIHAFHGDNQLRIEQRGGNWVLFYAERGEETDLEKFQTIQEARNACIKRLYRSAKITLNHRYILAHPEISLTSPEDMD